jgi:hypothetical protein
MKKLKYVLLIASLIFNSLNIFAVDNIPVKVSIDEEAVLDKIGIKKEDLNSSNQAQLKEKLKERVKQEIDPKINEIKNQLNQEGEKLKNSGKELIGGYIASTISLLMATLIGPQVLIACSPRPSAIIYAGTAAAYILSEIMLIKSFKASQLGEVTLVNNFEVNKNKSIKQNVAELKDKTHAQMSYFKEYKKTLDDGFKAIEKKGKNAKLASYGFMAASAAAIAEQMDWISGGGVCVGPVTKSNSIDIKKIHFNPKLDEYYIKLISQAETNQKKWSLYYEWEANKFGRENNNQIIQAQIKKIPQMNNELLTQILNSMILSIKTNIFNLAYAEETKISTKQQTVVNGLKENKAADFAGDLDKLGIVGGAAIHLTAYFMGWKLGFLTSIINSGTSRAITFGAQAAIAMLAGKMFENSAKDILGQLDKLDKLMNTVESKLTEGLEFFILSDADCKNIQKLGDKLGVHSDKLVTEMSIDQAANYFKEMEEKVKTKTEKEKKEFENALDNFKSKIKDEKTKEDFMKQLTNKVSFLPYLFSFVIESSYAYDYSCLDRKNCKSITLPRFNHPALTNLNSYLTELESLYSSTFWSNSIGSNKSLDYLDKNNENFKNYRNELFKIYNTKSKQNINFEKLEKNLMESELNNINNYLKKIPENDRAKLYALSGYSNSAMPQRNKLSLKEVGILNDLIKRLENNPSASEGKKVSSTNKAPSNLVAPESQKEESNENESYDIKLDVIHTQDKNIFEVIHIRYIDKIPELLNQ